MWRLISDPGSLYPSRDLSLPIGDLVSLIRPLAYESIEPRLKLFRPRLEPGLVYPRVWRTWDGPHLLVVGAVGKEKAVTEIGVEDGAVVGEPPVRHGVRIRDRAPLLSTQPTPWKGRQDQNLRLGLSRADLRDEARVAGDELSLAVADRLVSNVADHLASADALDADTVQHDELRLVAVQLAVLHAPQQALGICALRAEIRGLQRSEGLIPHPLAAVHATQGGVRPRPHLGVRRAEEDKIDVSCTRSVDKQVVMPALECGEQFRGGASRWRPNRAERRVPRRRRLCDEANGERR